MIAATLLASLAVLFTSTLALLLVPAHGSGHRELGGSATAIAVPAALGAALLVFLSVPVRTITMVAALLAIGSAVWLGKTARWSVIGHMAWSATVTAGAAFLAYTAVWTFRAGLGPIGVTGGILLWLLEAAAYLLSLAFLWEMVDAVASRRWDRRLPLTTETPDVWSLPFVSIHVPAHNEPPEMVIETLQSLLALDYPAYEVVMIDDNTDDEQLWRPVQAFCLQHPDLLRFHHLRDWPGYKSGALNFALTVTDPRADIVAVVDADYLVRPDWLRATTPLFADARLAFVQSPQDYREWEQSAYYRRLYHSYGYFFAVSQRSRDERGGAIFGGTMGLVRRSALEQVGGWDEWCITEDAELSLRLLKAGWSGRHVDTSYGRGIMPLTFEALKKQRFRWCFGGVQILRMHWRSLLPWDRSENNQLNRSQRLAYLSGGLQWFGDLLGLLFLTFLLVGALNRVFGGGLIIRRLSPLLLGMVPALTALALLRAVTVLRRVTGASWRDALGAFGLWLSLGVTVARACARGLVEPAGVFLRTPKTRGQASWTDALRANRTEAALGVLAAAVGIALLSDSRGAASLTLASLLAVTAVGHLAAPVNSLAALRAELSDELRRRRRSEWLRSWADTRIRPVHTLAGAFSVGAAGVLAAILLNPTTSAGRSPDVLREAGGHAPKVLGGSHSAPEPSRTPSPAPTPAAGSSPGLVTGPVPTGANRSPLPGGSSSPQPVSSATSSATAAPVPATTTSPGPSASGAPSPTTAPSSAPRPTPSSVPSSTSHPTPKASPTTRPSPTPPPHP
jgi:cellulose synthase/poly-beta-1,6-N-acetylglucosamine synthase-like glycosyltransferase